MSRYGCERSALPAELRAQIDTFYTKKVAKFGFLKYSIFGKKSNKSEWKTGPQTWVGCGSLWMRTNQQQIVNLGFPHSIMQLSETFYNILTVPVQHWIGKSNNHQREENECFPPSDDCSRTGLITLGSHYVPLRVIICGTVGFWLWIEGNYESHWGC